MTDADRILAHAWTREDRTTDTKLSFDGALQVVVLIFEGDTDQVEDDISYAKTIVSRTERQMLALATLRDAELEKLTSFRSLK